MKTVYVPNNGGHNYEPATEFGKLVFMSQLLIEKFQVSKMVRQFWEFLKESKEDDYLLVSGPSVACMVAAGIFGYLHGKLNLLLWRAHRDGNNRYLLRTVDFTKLRNTAEEEDANDK